MTSPSETIEKAMEGVTPDKLRYEADAMYAAVNGEEYGDTFHWQNWNDKPHRVVFDAVDLLRSAADQINALAIQVEAMKREMAEKDERIAALTGIDSAQDLIADWLSVGSDDLPDDTSVRIELGNRTVIGDSLGSLRRARTLIQGEKP